MRGGTGREFIGKIWVFLREGWGDIFRREVGRGKWGIWVLFDV